MDIETYLSGFDKAEKINKGMARDDKYRCRRGREEYLLRVADGEDFAEKKKEFEHLKRLSEAGLPVPKCVELVENDDGSKIRGWMHIETKAFLLRDLKKFSSILMLISIF